MNKSVKSQNSDKQAFIAFTFILKSYLGNSHMTTELHTEIHTELHTELHTLASIASELGVSKRAVQNWHKSALAGEHGELGRIIDGKRVFTDSEREILLSYASDRAKTKPAPESAPEPVTTAAEITVITGNHRSSLAAPNFGTTINLGQQRGGQEIQAYGDPMGAAAAALELMTTNIGAMATDLDRQQQQLAQTAQAVAALRQQAEVMQQAQQEYRIKSDLLGLMQNQQTGELSALLGKATAITSDGGQG